MTGDDCRWYKQDILEQIVIFDSIADTYHKNNKLASGTHLSEGPEIFQETLAHPFAEIFQ